jgi:ABC-type dipeptide/oligopeptide/nickel transport system permease component
MIISILGISMPIFWIGLILIIIFAVKLGWLPATGIGGISHLILPGIAIGANSLAVIARMTRSSMLEVLRQDYVTTAESKGLTNRIIIWKHCLKNALIPIVTTIGIQFGYLMGGAVLTESVFVYPGIGRLLVESIKRRDFPVVQVCILYIATMFIIVNMIVDLLYSWLDPKIRYQAGNH